MLLCANAGVPVFAIGQGIDNWRVLLEGPLPGIEGKRVFWDLVVSFGGDYPYTTPAFRFLSVPPLRQVSNMGRVRTSLLQKYHPRIHVIKLLNSVVELFEKDDGAPAEEPPFGELKWAPEDYDRLTKKACDDPILPLPDPDYLPIVSPTIVGKSGVPRVEMPSDLEAAQ
jgi:ubiquitin-protein ligase